MNNDTLNIDLFYSYEKQSLHCIHTHNQYNTIHIVY